MRFAAMRRAAPLLALTLSACACNPGAAESTDAGPVRVPAESVAVAEEQEIETGPRIAGELKPAVQAQIRAEVGGPVQAVEVEVGQSVEKGQLLARIEDRALQDALLSARSAVRSSQEELAYAQRQAERAERLVGAGAVAENELEAARSGLAGARARTADARARLAAAERQATSATVRAPMAGIVSRREVGAGDIVAPGSPLFTIIDPSSMRLEGQVPSEELAALQIGTPVRFEVRGYPDQTFAGEVTRIAPAADPSTRQIPVLVSIPNPGGRLLAGLFAEGRVASQRRSSVVVPLSALDETRGSPAVVRLLDGVAERVEVEVGVRDERRGFAEIRSGLEAGEQVLTGPARTVESGTPIEVRDAERAPS